jgi:putative hemolysin
LLIHEAYQHGVLQSRESELLQSILQFHTVKINTIMKPVNQIVWIDYQMSNEKIHELILSNDYYRYPVCKDSFNNVMGIISAKEFLTMYNDDPSFRLEEILYDPLIIPSDIDALRLLEKFRNVRSFLGLVTSSDGTIVGMITLQNLVEIIVGKLPDFYETREDLFYERDDGSCLLDAGLMLGEVREYLEMQIEQVPDLSLGAYFHTALERIPKVGDKLLFGDYQLEIVDMDGIRVDKILAKNTGAQNSEPR